MPKAGPLWLIAIGLLGMAGTARAADAPRVAAPPAYPATPRVAVEEQSFGIAVADPYRWLEADPRSDAAVADWVAAQNGVTRAYIDALPDRPAWARRIASFYDYDRVGLPKKAGGRYFYLRSRGTDPQPRLIVRSGLDARERVLIDPMGWDRERSAALAEWQPAPDGRRLAYAVQSDGSDWRTVRIIDVKTGAILPDRLDWVKFSVIAWMRDGSGFFYSRYPEPLPGQALRAESRDHAVWFHRVGTPQGADVRVHGPPDAPLLTHRAEVTDNGRYLVVRSSEGTADRHIITLYRLTGGSIGPAIPLVATPTDRWQLVASRKDRLIFLTTQGAPNGRLVALDARKPGPMTEIVPAGTRVLASATGVGNRIILAYLDDPDAEVRLVTWAGIPAGALNINEIGAASGFGGRSGDPETFFAFAGFTRPPTIFRYNVESGRVSEFAAPAPAFDTSDMVVAQRSYVARDGTRIPLYLVARRDVLARGKAPTLLYGYGGFAQALTPGFVPARLAWVANGGIFAMANIRGGGEFGASWHDAGRREHKQNSFNDFIDAAEFLAGSGLTTPQQLAIAGRSNGGLLVAAAVNQRPDLFGAALPSVGVMDMLRFDRFTAGRYWIDDYGDPSVERDFRTLLGYSPYHNVRSGRAYPAILVSTGDSDDRVVPAHSFKYAAALQAADIGANPRLLRVENGSGHGGGRPVDRAMAEWVDQMAFAAHQVGMQAK